MNGREKFRHILASTAAEKITNLHLDSDLPRCEIFFRVLRTITHVLEIADAEAHEARTTPSEN